MMRLRVRRCRGVGEAAAIAVVLGLWSACVTPRAAAESTPGDTKTASPVDGAPRAPSQPDPGLHRYTGKLGIAAHLGGTAGHLLLAPFAFALPGGGGDLKVRYTPDGWFFLEGRGHLSLGVDEGGVLGGGYGLVGAIGLRWFDRRWVSLSSDVHLGLSSYSLIPIPTVGLLHELELLPVDLGWFSWDLKLKAFTDLLLIVPSLGAGVSTAASFFIGPVVLGAEVAAEGDLLVAVVMNTASGALSARLFTGFAF